jgi:hypothetical protein
MQEIKLMVGSCILEFSLVHGRLVDRKGCIEKIRQLSNLAAAIVHRPQESSVPDQKCSIPAMMPLQLQGRLIEFPEAVSPFSVDGPDISFDWSKDLDLSADTWFSKETFEHPQTLDVTDGRLWIAD